MPKRCNVLLETVKELPPLQVLEIKGDGLCHGRMVPTQNLMGEEFRWSFNTAHRPTLSLSGYYGNSMLSFVRELALCKPPTPF